MKKRNNYLLSFAAGSVLMFSACQQQEQQVEQQQVQPRYNVATAKAEVQQVLDEQAACWSQGDLECYM